MSESEDLVQTSTISTKTVRMSTIGSRNKQGRLNDERRFYDDDKEPCNRLSSEKYFGRGNPDGEKSSITREHVMSSCSTSRRLSDVSSTGGDRDVDVESVYSEQSDRRRKQHSDSLTSRRSGGIRSRLTADFFHEDFNETMNNMIREFDGRSSLRFRDNDRSDRFFSQSILDDDDFFSRPLLSNRRVLQKSSNLRSIFDSPFDDSRSGRRSTDDGYADSGIFSEGRSSRLGQNIDDSSKQDKTLRYERRDTPEKFEVDIDVQGFKANELVVRTEGRRLVISAKQKNEKDTVDAPKKQVKEFQRQFDLPEGINPYDVTSNLLPDGFLRVEAPLKNCPAASESPVGRSTSDHSTTRDAPPPDVERIKNIES